MIVTRAAGFTVNVAVPLTAPTAMPIVVVPVPSVLASPCDPGVLLMVAATAFVELQCPACVTSCVVPSVYVPSALNVWLVPSGMFVAGGLTTIDTNCAGVTLNSVDPVMLFAVALIIAAPTATPRQSTGR